ncbi:MAG: leucine-rich repeat domain-containing protein [Oscillospiraceae bacterium]|nr:leucine-rich repeat domain-containing protein [Oscillospiraceae bacterium]
MNKKLKLLLIVLTAAALLAGGFFFFFHFRTDLTASVMERMGDFLSNHGFPSASLRVYSRANALDSGDAQLAMKLAQAYRKSGNYTKTERVLVQAIYSTPEDSRLYVLLSQVYVEEDKLLDAQVMLDGISNEAVREELAARRPTPPQIHPDSGFYSEYIPVEIQNDDPQARCYATMDGRFPTLASDLWEESVTLPGGETKVTALTVSDDGLVSTPASAVYTVAGVIEDVEFHDPSLQTATQELLHKEGRTLQTDDLWAIEELTLPEDLVNSRDLVLYTGLTKLVGRNLGELDYSFLASMPELRYLELEQCVLTTDALKKIGACPKLETLILADCGLSNIEPLSTLRTLQVLDLSDNSINSLEPLVELSNLQELYLGHNAVTGLPNLRGLQKLQILDLSYNAMDYVGSLAACTTIQRLNLSHNKLTSVSAVGGLTELIWFNGSNNEVLDVSALETCTKLEAFIMTDNKLTGVDFLAKCKNLKELNIDYNDVRTVPPFPKDCPLETFSAAHNFLDDLSGLGGLPKLSYVNADYNNIYDISVLKDCPELKQVNVYGTNIQSGGVLSERGIVVNFKPDF